jgi:hypothetical protein
VADSCEHRTFRFQTSQVVSGVVCREAFCSMELIISLLRISSIARTLLEDFCDKPIVIQSYCAVARLHGV